MTRVLERLLLWVADVLDRRLLTVTHIDGLDTSLLDASPFPPTPVAISTSSETTETDRCLP
jgi:hypothetical protein